MAIKKKSGYNKHPSAEPTERNISAGHAGEHLRSELSSNEGPLCLQVCYQRLHHGLERTRGVGLQGAHELPKSWMKKLVWVCMCVQRHIFLKRGSIVSMRCTKRTLPPKHQCPRLRWHVGPIMSSMKRRSLQPPKT